jgi:hypothetical protein
VIGALERTGERATFQEPTLESDARTPRRSLSRRDAFEQKPVLDIPLKFVEERLRASRNDRLRQSVYLNKGISNQAIRFRDIPSMNKRKRAEIVSRLEDVLFQDR